VDDSSVSVDFMHTTGAAAPGLTLDFAARVREPARLPLRYDPIQPQPDQLERQLAAGASAVQLLGAALEAIGAPAFVLRRTQVMHANSAGHATLDHDRPKTMAELREALSGAGDARYRITRLRSAGMSDHVLAVRDSAYLDERARAASLAGK
jgi:hypothetical protein